jgi:hypothetical protein
MALSGRAYDCPTSLGDDLGSIGRVGWNNHRFCDLFIHGHGLGIPPPVSLQFGLHPWRHDLDHLHGMVPELIPQRLRVGVGRDFACS